MSDEIYRILEISDSNNGEESVNQLLDKGWKFISACQVGTPEGMYIVYVVGATKKVYESTFSGESHLIDTINALEGNT